MPPKTRKRRATRKARVRRPLRSAVQHKVETNLQQSFELTLEGSALELVIRADGRMLGTLSIGKGSIGWLGRKDKRVLPLGWEMFVRLMERERRRLKSRRR